MKYKVIERMEYDLVYEVEATCSEHAESIYLDSDHYPYLQIQALFFEQSDCSNASTYG